MSDKKLDHDDLLAEVASLKSEINELKRANECMQLRLSEYRLFAEYLTRAETKDESFFAMMNWKPELVYKIAGEMDSPAKAKKFLFNC